MILKTKYLEKQPKIKMVCSICHPGKKIKILRVHISWFIFSINILHNPNFNLAVQIFNLIRKKDKYEFS
jgi:hypothetical protein